jgi:hypothetical protein
MRRTQNFGSGTRSGVAPWMVAGTLLLAASAPAAAQEATPAPVEGAAEVTAAQEATGDSGGAVGSAQQPVALPRTGTGPAVPDGGLAAVAIGATVSAAVAAVAVMRGRLGGRRI